MGKYSLLLGLLLALGCGGAKSATDRIAETDLKLFGAGYGNYADNNQRAPRTLEELNTVISSDRPIEFKNYTIIWGVDLATAAPRTVLAYEVSAPEKGGWVLFHDGKVERVSAGEFGQLTKATPAKSVQERKADVTLTPTEYLAEFKALEVKMSQKYRGKLVDLKGTVSSVSSMFNTQPELFISEAGKEHEYIRCEFAAGDDFWAKVSKGQQVTVRGTVRDPQGSAYMIDCAIVNTGPDVGFVTTAEELSKEFAADRDKAATKYEGKSFLLTGEVVSSSKPFSLIVQLKGASGKTISCQFKAGRVPADKLAPGTKFKLYGEYSRASELENCELISK